MSRCPAWPVETRITSLEKSGVASRHLALRRLRSPACLCAVPPEDLVFTPPEEPSVNSAEQPRIASLEKACCVASPFFASSCVASPEEACVALAEEPAVALSRVASSHAT